MRTRMTLTAANKKSQMESWMHAEDIPEVTECELTESFEELQRDLSNEDQMEQERISHSEGDVLMLKLISYVRHCENGFPDDVANCVELATRKIRQQRLSKQCSQRQSVIPAFFGPK